MPYLFYYVGLPGSGKSTHAEKLSASRKRCAIVSSDAVRHDLWGDANDQREPGKVFEEMFKRVRFFLERDYDIIYDATNLSAKKRASTLSRIRREIKVPMIARCIFVSCPLEECKDRQEGRERKVPVEVIDRMVRQFQPPWYNEGWDDIVIVDGSEARHHIGREHWLMKDEPHDNPHHTSTLEQHCNLCASHVFLNSDGIDNRLRALLVEAGYNHDLGKHATKTFTNTKGDPTSIAHYYSHHNVGAYYWLTGDRRDCYSTHDFLFIGALIHWHMQPYFISNDEDGAQLKQWCDKHKFDAIFHRCLSLLHEADKQAH